MGKICKFSTHAGKKYNEKFSLFFFFFWSINENLPSFENYNDLRYAGTTFYSNNKKKLWVTLSNLKCHKHHHHRHSSWRETNLTNFYILYFIPNNSVTNLYFLLPIRFRSWLISRKLLCAVLFMIGTCIVKCL